MALEEGKGGLAPSILQGPTFYGAHNRVSQQTHPTQGFNEIDIPVAVDAFFRTPVKQSRRHGE